jgi:hypothetical protein
VDDLEAALKNEGNKESWRNGRRNMPTLWEKYMSLDKRI